MREYTETYYLPAAGAYRERSANKGGLGVELLEWRHRLAEHWHEARFGATRAETRGAEHHVTVEVYLGDLDPGAVRVELYDDTIDSITLFDPLTGAISRKVPRYTVYPGTHYVTPRDRLIGAVDQIREDLGVRVRSPAMGRVPHADGADDEQRRRRCVDAEAEAVSPFGPAEVIHDSVLCNSSALRKSRALIV